MPSELTNKTSAPRNDSFLSRNSNKLLIAGLVFFFIPTALRTYFVMPFPGSQDLEVISLAYYLEKTLIYSRLIGMALLAGPITIGILHPRLIKKILFTFLIIAMGSFYYVFDFEFTAEKFFPEPENLAFEQSDANQVPLENLIIGVKYGGEAKAYPLNYLAYHHKIQDTVGGLPVLITYCIMCRSGRVFSPILDDEHHTFRVVGANHYNAIFEDQKTGSWWYQATGEAVVGKLKGALLEELDYEQLTLAAWVEQQPETYIMQPDSIYSEAYEARKEFDRRLRVEADSAGVTPTFERKSWVIGIKIGDKAKAYDWADLIHQRVINDTFENTKIVIVLEEDTFSYHVWNARVGHNNLSFRLDTTNYKLYDMSTGSEWNMSGRCISGELQDQQLRTILAHQEYWFSWKTFHPNTLRWHAN